MCKKLSKQQRFNLLQNLYHHLCYLNQHEEEEEICDLSHFVKYMTKSNFHHLYQI